MKSKTWNIGESCRGGVITAEIHESGKIKVIGKQWDQSQGWSKNSDQSNAVPFTDIEVDGFDWPEYSLLDDFLNELTTYYYAEQVLKWIKDNY